MLVSGSSFHASLAAQYSLVSYSRATPLQCSNVEFDTTGCFVPWDSANPQSCYWQAPVACTVIFYANALCLAPVDTTWFACWLMKNVLPPPDGSTGGESAGFDAACYTSATRNNVSSACQRIFQLQPGDKIWPVCGSNESGLIVPPGSGCNYFEGQVLSIP